MFELPPAAPHAPLRELAGPVDEARLLHNLQAVRRRQLQRKVRRARIGASLASLAACAALAWFGRTFWLPDAIPSAARPGPLTVTSGLALLAHGPARRYAPGQDPAQNQAGDVTLDDGSRIHLGNQSRLELIENSGQRVRSVLHAGWARFEVKPGGPRRWIVDTGLAEVEVVGTAFSVLRSASETRVRVHHGRVLVRSALAGELTQLGAGQELRVPAAARLAGVTQANTAPVVAAPTSEATSEPSAAQRVSARSAPAAQPVSDAPPTAVPTSTQRSHATSVSSARSALMRADALRASGDTGRAAQVLASELAARPDAREVGLIALTLAQLQLDELRQAAQAAQSFALASQASGLPPALREQALARQVEALLRSGQPAAARALAHDYAERYPHGSWSNALHGWLENAPRSGR
jgi:transmembrane sensor